VAGPASDEEPPLAHGNEVFGIEVRGFDPIPEPERNMALRQVDHLWAGTSVNLLSFALGAMAITLGLNLWLAIAACSVGSLPYACVAFGSIVTARVGLPVTTLARAAFGVRGNAANAFLAWMASVAFEVINTIFGVDALLALLRALGWSAGGGPAKWVAVLLQLALCGGIAVLGHATMIWFQRIFAAVVGAVLLIVMAFTFEHVDWAHAATAHAPLTSASVLATFLTACAALASNPMSFLFNGPDWVRYLPSRTPARQIFGHVFWASYLPSLALTVMGAWCATLGDMSDPVAGLRPYLPQWLFIFYILAVVGGSLANNVPTYYSSGLSLQAIGLKVHRHVATSIDVVASTAIALYILFVQDFSTALNDFIALLIVWVGPFGGVWIGDALLRRGRYDVYAIHTPTRGSLYWGWMGVNPSGFVALLAGIGVATLAMKSPLYEGPLATVLGGADLSWILGFPVSMLAYGALKRARERLWVASPVLPIRTE
jgi:NCS1 family nucleobase:cation symporter-1